jgi:hypothetical protein
MSLVHLGSSLKQTGVEVENISGCQGKGSGRRSHLASRKILTVGLTTGRSSEKKGHLTVSDGLLGQIVEDDKSVLSVVSEPLSHCGTREGSEVLQRSGLGSGSSNDDGVFQGIVLFQSLDELSDSRTLLSDGDVDTVELGVLIRAVVPLLLVEHGVECDGGLSGLTISNDKLSLSSADRYHCVDGLETSHHWL